MKASAFAAKSLCAFRRLFRLDSRSFEAQCTKSEQATAVVSIGEFHAARHSQYQSFLIGEDPETEGDAFTQMTAYTTSTDPYRDYVAERIAAMKEMTAAQLILKCDNFEHEESDIS